MYWIQAATTRFYNNNNKQTFHKRQLTEICDVEREPSTKHNSFEQLSEFSDSSVEVEEHSKPLEWKPREPIKVVRICIQTTIYLLNLIPSYNFLAVLTPHYRHHAVLVQVLAMGLCLVSVTRSYCIKMAVSIKLFWLSTYLTLRLKKLQLKTLKTRKVQASLLRQLTCHMGSHSVTCHLAKVTSLPLPQPIKAGTRFSDPKRIQD